MSPPARLDDSIRSFQLSPLSSRRMNSTNILPLADLSTVSDWIRPLISFIDRRIERSADLTNFSSSPIQFSPACSICGSECRSNQTSLTVSKNRKSIEFFASLPFATNRCFLLVFVKSPCLRGTMTGWMRFLRRPTDIQGVPEGLGPGLG